MRTPTLKIRSKPAYSPPRRIYYIWCNTCQKQLAFKDILPKGEPFEPAQKYFDYFGWRTVLSMARAHLTFHHPQQRSEA